MIRNSVLSSEESESLASRIDFEAVSGSEIVVTGASGMIGAYITSSLIEGCTIQGLRPPKLTLLSRSLKSGNISRFSEIPCVKLVETQLVGWKVDRSFDFLIHAASPASPTKYSDPEAVIQANLGFLESIKKQSVPRVILYISSGEVYGSSPPRSVDEDYKGAVIPISTRAVYPEAKIATERLLLEMGGAGLTSPLIARLFHSFGPGLRMDDGRSFGDFLWSAARGRDLSLLTSGSAIRTLLYIEDAVAGLLTVLTKGSPGEAYNVGSDNSMVISEFADLVARVAQVKVQYPSSSEEPRAGYVPSPNQVIVPSIKKVSDLGWRQIVPLEIGVKRTLDWIQRELGASNGSHERP
jgi:dTDP-glucose 4,6-dehydratase